MCVFSAAEAERRRQQQHLMVEQERQQIIRERENRSMSVAEIVEKIESGEWKSEPDTAAEAIYTMLEDLEDMMNGKLSSATPLTQQMVVAPLQ